MSVGETSSSSSSRGRGHTRHAHLTPPFRPPTPRLQQPPHGPPNRRRSGSGSGSGRWWPSRTYAGTAAHRTSPRCHCRRPAATPTTTQPNNALVLGIGIGSPWDWDWDWTCRYPCSPQSQVQSKGGGRWVRSLLVYSKAKSTTSNNDHAFTLHSK